MDNTTKLALRVTGAYLFVGVLWILFSDVALSLLITDVRLYVQMEILKGWAFVLVSGGMLYLFLKKWTAVFLRDVAKRKQAEETLAESEKRYRKLVTISPDALYVHVDGRVTLVNPAMCMLLGADQASELLGKSVFDIIHPEYHGMVRERWKTIFNDDVARPIEQKFVRLDGTVIDVEVSAVAVDPGRRKEVQVIARDITERKRAERALRDSEQRYRLLFEANPHPMWFFDPVTLAFLDVNEAAIQHYGYSREEFLSLTINDIRPPEDVTRLLDDAAEVRKGIDIRGQWRHKKKDGTILHVEITSHETEYSGRTVKVALALDVTKRVTAEEELKKLSSVVEQAGDSVIITNREGVIEYVNPAFESTTGYSKDLVIGETPRILKSGRQSSEYYKNLWQTILARKTFRDIVINKKKNGDFFYEEHTITPIVDAGGEIIHFVSTGRDITKRKLAEDALELANSQLRSLHDNLDEALFSIDTVQNKMLQVSIAHETIFGYPRVEFFKNPQLWYDVIVPEDKPIVHAGYRVLLSGKGLQHQVRVVRPDGQIRWIEARIKPTLDTNGKLVRIDGMASDITDRKRAEQDLLESTERFRQLTDTIKEVFWLTNPQKNEILYISRGYEEIWGRTCDSLLANQGSWAESIHPDDHDRVVQSGMPVQVLGTYDEEYRIVRPDGIIRWIHEKAFPIKDQKGEVFRVAGIAEDITERKSLEQQLRQAQKLESLGSLAGGIAHDFNNILGIIMGHASLLNRYNENNSEKLTRSTEAITKASQRGASLVRQLLTFARKTEPLLESASVNDIIFEIAKLIEETFPQTITISHSLAEGLPGIVADSNQLHQMVLNLCVNARDAMPDGGRLTILTSISSPEIVRREFADANARKYVCISISDTGTGMDEATRQCIFEPFFTTKEVGKGTGLGLAVVYGIVKSLNGHIGVESSVGKGTTFRLYFPVMEHDIPAFEATAAEPSNIPGGNETILVVEDEEMLIDLITTLLEAKGYHVLRARDGEEAVDVYKRHTNSISLVISDLGLPKSDGHSAHLKMKEINPHVKTIIASGYIGSEQRSAIILSGVKDIIIKPYVPAQMMRLVREVIDRKP